MAVCVLWKNSGVETSATRAVFFILWISRVEMAGKAARKPSGIKNLAGYYSVWRSQRARRFEMTLRDCSHPRTE